MRKISNINKFIRLAVLTSIALTIFMIELQIPPLVPIPGVKLGLANIITLVVLIMYGRQEAFLVMITRIMLGCMFSGQMISFFYSLSGGMLCLIVMSVLLKVVKKEGIIFISIIGAIAHNIGQITVAILIFQTIEIVYYLPVLLISAVITGIFIGLISKYFIKNRVLVRLISEEKDDILIK